MAVSSKDAALPPVMPALGSLSTARDTRRNGGTNQRNANTVPTSSGYGKSMACAALTNYDYSKV
jgi:hypothetical protein